MYLQFFLQKVEMKFPNDRGLLNRMSIIEEAQPQQIRMAHLAVVGSHKVNGVAALHSNLIKTTVRTDVAFCMIVKYKALTFFFFYTLDLQRLCSLLW